MFCWTVFRSGLTPRFLGKHRSRDHYKKRSVYSHLCAYKGFQYTLNHTKNAESNLHSAATLNRLWTRRDMVNEQRNTRSGSEGREDRMGQKEETLRKVGGEIQESQGEEGHSVTGDGRGKGSGEERERATTRGRISCSRFTFKSKRERFKA